MSATVTVYAEGRTGQRVGIQRQISTGELVAVLIEQRDGTFKRLTRPPRWLAPGLWHAECARRNLTGSGQPCSKCVPSLFAREEIAKAKHATTTTEGNPSSSRRT